MSQPMKMTKGHLAVLTPLLTLVLAACAGTPAPDTSPGASEATEQRVLATYGKLPLHFEANQGQSDTQVKFLSRGPGHTLFLTSTEAVLVLTKREQPAKGTLPGARLRSDEGGEVSRTLLRMTFAGANPTPRVTGREELPGTANYFIGNDPTKWRTNVPTYARVRYGDVYPGIDLVWYGTQGQLEYDLVVRPGADPTRIVLGFRGADQLALDAQGDLVLHTPLGPVHQRRPVIYQEVEGVRREVSGSYVLSRTPSRSAFTWPPTMPRGPS